MTTPCLTCFEPTDAPGHADAHAAELARDAAFPQYKALKANVVAATTAYIAAQAVAASQTSAQGFTAMTRQVQQELEALRRDLAPRSVPQSVGDLSGFVAAMRATKAATAAALEAADDKMLGRGADAAVGADAPELPELQAYKSALVAVDAYLAEHAVGLSDGGALPAAAPWRLCYLADLMHSGDGVVNFEGGLITDADGNVMWTTTCDSCGVLLQRGGFGSGAVRVTRLDDRQCAMCSDCWRLLETASRQWPGATALTEWLPPPDSTFDVTEHDDQVSLRVRVAGATHIVQALRSAFVAFSSRPCLGTPTSSGYVWTTYGELLQRVEAFAAWMTATWIAPCRAAGRREPLLVGISSLNRTEFVVADLACAWCGLVAVGLHTTMTDAEASDVVAHAGIEAVVCDADRLPRFTAALASTLPHPIVCMDSPPHGCGVIGLAGCSAPRDVSVAMCPVVSAAAWTHAFVDERPCEAPDDLMTIIYTSGTAGSPKGVMVGAPELFADVGHALNVTPLVTVSYIPLSHSTDRLRLCETILNGGRCGFAQYAHTNWEDHEQHVGKDRFDALQRVCGTDIGATFGVGEIVCEVARLRPTIFIAPPRVWHGFQALHKRIAAESASADAAAAAVRCDVFGGRLVSIATGGGPTDTATFRFAAQVLQLPLLESYGATEVGGVAVGFRFPTVEATEEPIFQLPLVTGARVTLEAVETPSDGARQGVALIHTPVMARGYWRNAAATASAFVQVNGVRCFMSGDVCEALPPTGAITSVRVIDRLKHLVRLPCGTTLSLEAAEAKVVLATGAAHAAAIPVGEQRPDGCVVPFARGYVVVASVPGLDPATFDDAALQFRTSLSDELPKPLGIILDANVWVPSPTNRLTGLLTASLKVNRAAVALQFQSALGRFAS